MGEYRYGFNGQEKSSEINGEGNSYTAQFWEYDPRIGRRWNVDPVDLHFQSVYSCLDNNPISYIDPDGLYSTKERAEKMRQRAIDGGRDVGEVFYREKQKDYVFNELKVEARDGEMIAKFKTHSDSRYFGSFFQRVGDFLSDVNPIESAEIYVGVLAKTELSLLRKYNIKIGDENFFKEAIDAKMVIPFGGGQGKLAFKNGKFEWGASLVTAEQSYANVKYRNVDVRVMPFNRKSIGGDYDPGARVLYTFAKSTLVVPVFDVPVPIGEGKLQADFQTHFSKTTIGARAAAETFALPTLNKEMPNGVKIEGNGGIRFVLKVPDLFKN
ncbi:RHS repeat-associated core domain-containing protein [Chitinophaga agri]|uniref:RHS repeat-associated core domain-containing protein n=1 Tax=Chitinophaga agri TaxID=2703787 RepID=A0A6B9Z740_9BACT|nr:RHS repeat-associated core domain-containing protein [Chitinophaga agri]QHS58040.1 hypothetical protein GWR21_00070 [Chitinophaga agri]QHS58046.1 hypothetical protein GWR21_00100 [Chitinophaga agri]